MTREEAIRHLHTLSTTMGSGQTSDEQHKEAKRMAIEALSADAVHGEWVIRENGNKECSVCGHERQDGWDYFCGYCGARMKAR